ncbi:MAG: restriction endonuclease subunit S [Clostridia bacterium]|nr:restriction endonuclease subunit S [Clostridia bacterium]
MKKYSEYTPTGIAWNENMPSHWTSDKAKHIFSNPKQINKGNSEKNILSLTLKGVIRNDADNPIGLAPSDYSTYQIFEENELVFKLIDLENISTSRVGIVHERGIMSSAYIRLHPRIPLNLKYFYYQYYDWYKRNIFNGLGAGVRQTLSAADLLNYNIVIPPVNEQDQIVRYLDWRMALINRFVKEKRAEIKLLQELRQTIINRAVTEGIDSTVEFKDTGVSWLPRIPKNWEIVPSKTLFAESKKTRKPDDLPATASQKYGIILQSDFMQREGRRIVVAGQNLEAWKHVEPDNFVISLRSFQGGIEHCAIVGCVTWHYIVLIPCDRIEPRYFKWLFKSKSYITALQRTSDFIRDGQDLRYSNFVKVPLPIFSKQEQNDIADYIEKWCNTIDKTIEGIKEEVLRVEELRVRTIYDVVTGNIDVRDVTIPAFDEADGSYEIDESESDETVDEEVDE